MSINALIAQGGTPVRLENPMNSLAQMMQIKQAQQQNQLGEITMQQHQQALDENNKLNALYSGALGADGKLDRTKLLQSAATANLGKLIPNLQKGFTEQDKAQGEVTKSNIENFEAAKKSRRDALIGITTPEEYMAWHEDNHNDPILGPMLAQRGITADSAKARIAAALQQPGGFSELLKQSAMGIDKFTEQNKPSIHQVNNGQTTTMMAVPGLGGAPVAVNTQQMQATPDAVMTDKRARYEGALNRAQALTVAGLDPNGGPTPDMEVTAKAIASGQLPPPSGMALTNPKNQRILARVMEINPQYDFTDITAKKKAASDFTSGNQGNALRSFAVAGQHLDQLGTLVDALGNGDTQIINKIANAYSTQTGNAAPTNFNAAKDVVSKEVMKAIVGGGGGVSEREELAKSMAQANSPQQLRGVISQYRNLMSAQHDALLQQRRAAGLSDSTLPKYSTDAPSNVPPEIAAILAKHGAK